MQVTLDVGLRQQADPARMHLTGSFDPTSGWLDWRADIAGLRLAELAAFSPDLPLESLDLPVGGKIATRIHVDGLHEPLTFDLQGGTGQVALPKYLDAPLAIKSFALAGELALVEPALAAD